MNTERISLHTGRAAETHDVHVAGGPLTGLMMHSPSIANEMNRRKESWQADRSGSRLSTPTAASCPVMQPSLNFNTLFFPSRVGNGYKLDNATNGWGLYRISVFDAGHMACCVT